MEEHKSTKKNLEKISTYKHKANPSGVFRSNQMFLKTPLLLAFSEASYYLGTIIYPKDFCDCETEKKLLKNITSI